MVVVRKWAISVLLHLFQCVGCSNEMHKEMKLTVL